MVLNFLLTYYCPHVNILKSLADVAELADAPDLGSGTTSVGVQVPSSAPNKLPFMIKNLSIDGSLFFVLKKYGSLLYQCDNNPVPMLSG